MELYILDRDLNLKGILDAFFSFRWVRRYYKTGEFELHCALTPTTLELLTKENVIYKKDDSEAGYIEYRQLKQDQQGKEILVVRGKFITGYFNRRIALGTNTITNTAENTIRTLINNNVVNPTNTNRIIPKLILGANNGYTGTTNYTLENKELLEDITNIATLSELGFRTDFNISNKQFIFNIYKGLDRSVNQSVNPRAIFSKEFENILEQEYTDSLNNYKNVAYGSIKSLGSTTGLDRFEMYAGKDLDVALSKRPVIKTFESKINLNSNLKYKVNFDLGDIVTCVSKKWGVIIDTRITEIEEVYEQQGLSINVMFGNNIPTLIDKIKQMI